MQNDVKVESTGISEVLFRINEMSSSLSLNVLKILLVRLPPPPLSPSLSLSLPLSTG